MLVLLLAACAHPVDPIYNVDPSPFAAALADPDRPADDVARDALRKPAETLAFAEVTPGMHVAELAPGGGYFTRLFARAVGPAGTVTTYVSADTPDKYAAGAIALVAAGKWPNVTLLRTPTFVPTSAPDLVFTAQNYHDFHGGDIAALNASIYQALRPGGAYVVIDHAAVAGSGATATSTLHRIDEATVVSEVTAAGFTLEATSDLLRHPEDPRTAAVFTMHDQTDQFALRFRKPR